MLQGLLGNWKVIGCQLNGTWLPDSIFREFRYGFQENDTFFLLWGELSFPQYVGGFPKSKTGRVKIDTSVTPHAIDLLPDDGPFAGKTFQGIFELDHDVMKGNFAFPDHPRPQVFSAQQGQVYEIWQRV